MHQVLVMHPCTDPTATNLAFDKFMPIPFDLPEPDAATKLLHDMQDWMYFCSPCHPCHIDGQGKYSTQQIDNSDGCRMSPSISASCLVDGCYKAATHHGGLCLAHSVGKVCKEAHCSNAAQSHGFCKGHGGGARCKFTHCNKSSQGGGFCRAHGGGKRCSVDGCTKGVQRSNKCATHGGGRSCTAPGCTRSDRGGGLCDAHRKERKCKIYGCKRLGYDMGMCKPHTRRYLCDYAVESSSETSGSM
ncbi:Aste57867_2089 [Aphanomyces stellatus]|uniref:Aste57867_2089 protein n=1 Tax=Aphanomyces stellatus TaxID=120398 RepID=A0A485KCC9_9STRA|nr:hypothetical protein As57867_002084 [Aphanomyces stellatus]VFT79292.1 Aste57867_2089 [Aphanomyces stellatus]